MIITPAPSFTRIVQEVWKPLGLLFVWDVIVTAAYFILPFRAPALPVTLFGTVLALLLGARSNSAYQRWWEGRILWGALVNASRSLARVSGSYLANEPARDLKRSIVLRHVAYVHALRCQLRRQPVEPAVLRFLSPGEADIALARTNAANALLEGNGLRLEQARAAGWIDSVQQSAVERILGDIANAQGGMERLKNTPLPIQFRFIPTLFTHLFCLLLPIGLVETLGLATPLGSTIAGLMFLAVLAVGEDLVDPFAGTVHDVPLTALCRTIEIDLLESIGDPAPAPLTPTRGILM